MSVGGVAVFPSDTVYGLACDAQDRLAVERLYRLKRRRLDKPSAVMFFVAGRSRWRRSRSSARGPGGAAAAAPGAVTVLLPNPARRYPLACGDDPLTLGLRVPVVPRRWRVRWPVLQSSANLAGEARSAAPAATCPSRSAAAADMRGRRRRAARHGVDGRRPAATMRRTARVARSCGPGRWTTPALQAALEWQFHFDPATYAEMIREDIPVYDRFQDELVAGQRHRGPAGPGAWDRDRRDRRAAARPPPGGRAGGDR